jgi:hypothetical protein
MFEIDYKSGRRYVTNQLRGILVTLGCACALSPAYAYEEENHKQMSSLAINSSVLVSQDKLNQFGFLYGADDSRQLFSVPDNKGVVSWKTIREAVQVGADLEDKAPRVVNHFFNPLTGGALSILGTTLLDDPSPDWALEDNRVIGFNIAGSQDFSYRDAQDYFLNALIGSTKADRERNWGLTFRALGQVIHHVQDMTQPQHVRNDGHLNLNAIGVPNIWLITNPSTYEKWVFESKDESKFASYPAYAPVYSPDNPGNFSTPRQFWTTTTNGTGGIGLAEYTNRNFFSMGTLWPNNSNFPQPVTTTYEVGVDVATLCQNAVPACPPGVSGKMSFSHTMANDNLRPQATQENPRAMAFSIYSYDDL